MPASRRWTCSLSWHRRRRCSARGAALSGGVPSTTIVPPTRRRAPLDPRRSMWLTTAAMDGAGAASRPTVRSRPAQCGTASGYCRSCWAPRSWPPSARPFHAGRWPQRTPWTRKANRGERTRPRARRLPMAPEYEIDHDTDRDGGANGEARGVKRTPGAREKDAPLAVNEADGGLDELQAWYLGKAEREGWVYTSALRQLG